MTVIYFYLYYYVLGLRHDGTRPVDAAADGATNSTIQKEDPWAVMMQHASAISGLPVSARVNDNDNYINNDLSNGNVVNNNIVSNNTNNRSQILDRQRQGRAHAGIFTNKAQTALCCLPLSNAFRRQCIKIVDNKIFDNFILVVIVGNCIALGMDKPMSDGDKSEKKEALENIESVFLTIFTLECFLKIVAYGFIFHPNAYLRTWWNMLDFSIVVMGLLSTLATVLPSLDVDIKGLRAIRVLRPLRLISGLPSLQVVLNSIFRAIVPLVHIFLLASFVMVIYAVIGIELFMNKLNSTCYVKNKFYQPKDTEALYTKKTIQDYNEHYIAYDDIYDNSLNFNNYDYYSYQNLNVPHQGSYLLNSNLTHKKEFLMANTETIKVCHPVDVHTIEEVLTQPEIRRHHQLLKRFKQLET